jgi:hypothetical protein
MSVTTTQITMYIENVLALLPRAERVAELRELQGDIADMLADAPSSDDAIVESVR